MEKLQHIPNAPGNQHDIGLPMMKADLHILMLEDEPLDAELNKAQLLLLEEYNCIVNVASDKLSYLNALRNSTPDIILSDYNLPQYNGLEALHDLISVNKLVPFIFVTGTLNEEIAAETIKAGAWDYVVKDRLFRLPLAIRGALKVREERQIAHEAEEKINRLLMAIDQTSSQIIMADEKGNIEYVNKKFTEVTGFSMEEVLGKLATALFSLDDIIMQNGRASLEMLRNGEVIRGEILSRRKDNTTFWEMVTITPIKNAAGKITNFIGVKEDITRRKIMEQELIEALDKAERSDKLKDAFLQNLSHEIRTPLNAIVGFSELLNTGTEQSLPKVAEYTSIILDSSKQLLSIVSNILTMASIQTGHESIHYKTVNLDKLMDHIHEGYLPMAIMKNLAFSVSKPLSDKPALIRTDEAKLSQILTNLLDNAFKFTRRGSVEIKYSLCGKTVDFFISDTGIGIPEENQSVIFERFRQGDLSIHTEFGGTGLGLSISSSFARMLGGELRVESEQDKGSTFILSMPFSPAEDTMPPQPQPGTSPDNRILTILVVEDEVTNYLLIKEYLDIPEHKLLYAENGLKALNMCEENPQIDLVLMDIKMPVMDGIQAFREIRKLYQHLPVIAQTAYALEEEKLELLDIGFTDYIAKPIEREKLLSMINSCTGKTD